MTTSREDQLKLSIKSLKNSRRPIDTGHFHSSNHQKWLPFQLLGGKTLRNVQIDQQQRRYGQQR